MVTAEGIALSGCLRYLKAREIYHWRNNTGAFRMTSGNWVSFGKKGSSDILGLLPGGRMLAVEVKSPSGRLSPLQHRFITDVQALGGLACVIRDWRELDKILQKEGYVNNGLLFSGIINE